MMYHIVTKCAIEQSIALLLTFPGSEVMNFWRVSVHASGSETGLHGSGVEKVHVRGLTCVMDPSPPSQANAKSSVCMCCICEE